jgi:hypothetical protein
MWCGPALSDLPRDSVQSCGVRSALSVLRAVLPMREEGVHRALQPCRSGARIGQPAHRQLCRCGGVQMSGASGAQRIADDRPRRLRADDPVAAVAARPLAECPAGGCSSLCHERTVRLTGRAGEGAHRPAIGVLAPAPAGRPEVSARRGCSPRTSSPGRSFSMSLGCWVSLIRPWPGSR